MTDQIVDNVNIEGPEVQKNSEEFQVRPTDHIKEKRRGREERSKKKDDKRQAEQLLKGLNDVHTTEDKIGVVCKKYSEVVDENRKLQLTLKQYDKKMLVLQREKEQLQSERSKALLTRERLESLCRELQKQNKAIKEESLLKIREQEQMRRKLSEQFRGNLAQVKTLMNANIDKNTKMYEEYLKMNKTFETVQQEVQLTEHQLLTAHKRIKLALEDSKEDLEKVKAEKDALQQKNQHLLFKITEYQAQIKEMQETEVALKCQVTMYTDKYDEFQKALLRSDKISGEFNEEMTLMSKKILMLEEETCLWKERWENIHSTLLEMAADKQARDTEIASLRKKLSLLQDLCKVFQRERANLIAQLKKKEGSAGGSQSEKSDEADSQEDEKAIKQVSEAIEKRLKEDSCESTDAEQKENTESEKKESKEESSVSAEDEDGKAKQSSEESKEVADSLKDDRLAKEESVSKTQAPNAEDTSVEVLEKRNVELNNVCANKKDDANKEVSENMERFHDEVNSVHTETENILEQLYEAIESVQCETANGNEEALKNTLNSTNALCKSNRDPNTNLGNAIEKEHASIDSRPDKEASNNSNERVEDNGHAVVNKHGEDQSEKNSNLTNELITQSEANAETPNKEQPAETTPSLTQTDVPETKTTKSAPTKNGKRKKK